jgi:geranylgeranyl diphosphate synthase type II
MTDLKAQLKERAILVEAELDKLLPSSTGLERSVCEAMRYSVFAGGKRIRPFLILATTELCGGSPTDALPAACAIEMIHSYSLIHDDLPAMDDGKLRRGKPTVHIQFGEAVAILAGDALLTLAFETLARCPGRIVAPLVYELASASGVMGMVGGQAADIEWTGKNLELPTLEYIHSHKTGALIAAAVRMGAIVAGAGEDVLKELTGYGRCIGLAFQISDDIIDVESSAAVTGKDSGADAAKGKITYPGFFGISESRQHCLDLVEKAKEHLAGFGQRAATLEAVADLIANRKA